MDEKVISYEAFVSLLKNMQKNDYESIFYLFYNACINKNFEVCKAILDSGFNINYREKKYNETVLLMLTDYNSVDLEIVKFLNENGADLNAETYCRSSYYCALDNVVFGDFDVIKYLCENSKNNIFQSTHEVILKRAIESANVEDFKYFVSKFGMSSKSSLVLEFLETAVKEKNEEIAKIILEYINDSIYWAIKDMDITSAFNIAISNDDIKMQNLLKEYCGKNINLDNK